MVSGSELLSGLGSLSYLGIFGISLVANILVIIPEEAVLLGLGYAARAGSINLLTAIPLVMAGLLISDLVLYGLSRAGSKTLQALYDRFFARRLAFFSKRFEGRQQWMETHIKKVIFFSRFLMQLRFLGPFMAGRLRVPLRTFLLYEILALLIYVPTLLLIGWYFRSRVERVIGDLKQVHLVLLLFIIFILLLPLLQSYLRRLFKRKAYTHEDTPVQP